MLVQLTKTKLLFLRSSLTDRFCTKTQRIKCIQRYLSKKVEQSRILCKCLQQYSTPHNVMMFTLKSHDCKLGELCFVSEYTHVSVFLFYKLFSGMYNVHAFLEYFCKCHFCSICALCFCAESTFASSQFSTGSLSLFFSEKLQNKNGRLICAKY